MCSHWMERDWERDWDEPIRLNTVSTPAVILPFASTSAGYTSEHVRELVGDMLER